LRATARAASPLTRSRQRSSRPFRLPFGTSFNPSALMVSMYGFPLIRASRRGKEADKRPAVEQWRDSVVVTLKRGVGEPAVVRFYAALLKDRNGNVLRVTGVPRIPWTVASLELTGGPADVYARECRASSHDV
jgi:hypothetical protein